MQRWIPLLALALLLQLGIAGFLGWRSQQPVVAPPAAALVSADLKTVDQVVIDGPAAAEPPAEGASAPAAVPRVEIVKRDGRWMLPGYHDTPADATKLQALLDRLHTLPRGLPVTTTAESLPRFKVVDKEHERRLVASADGKAVATVYLGTSPGLRKSHARSGDDSGVYAVELQTSDFSTTPADWLDPALLKQDPNTLQEISLGAAGKPPLVLRRAAASDGAAAGAWQVQDPPPGRQLDAAAATALVDAITGLQVSSVLGLAPQADWQQSAPLLRVGFKDAQGQTRDWVLSKTQGAEVHVLKAGDRPWYLEATAGSAQALLDAASADRLLVPDTPAPAASAAPEAASAPR